MSRRRRRWTAIAIVALALGAGALYAASAPARDWLRHALHGR